MDPCSSSVKKQQSPQEAPLQGSSQFMQTTPLHGSAQSLWSYKKETSASSTKGCEFEYGLSAVLFLRLLHDGGRFIIGSNCADMGKFDDLVISVKGQVLCVQLKHVENCSKTRSLVGLLPGFYESYKEIRVNQENPGPDSIMRLCQNVLFDDMFFIFYSNYPVKHLSVRYDVPSEIRRLLTTGQNEGIFRFNVDDREVREFLEKDSDKVSRAEFLSRFLIFSQQSSTEDIFGLVKELVAERVQVTVKQAEAVSSRFLSSVKSWWEKRVVCDVLSEQTCLTNSSLNIKSVKEMALEAEIEFQGHTLGMSQLGDKEELLSILTECPEVSYAVLMGDKVRLGRPLPTPGKIYLPRKLRHETILDPRVLEQTLDGELFAVSCCPKDRRLTSSCCKISGTGGLLYQDHKYFLNLCERERGKNIHFVSFDESFLLWRETFGDDQMVKPYVQKLSGSCFTSPGGCYHQGALPSGWTKKLRLVTGQAGMGKSTLLRQIAIYRKRQSPESFVILVPLHDHSTTLYRLSQNEVSLREVMGLLSEAFKDEQGTSPKMDNMMIKQHLDSTGRVTVLLDAVDEVSPKYKDTVLKIVKILVDQRTVHEVWVSARPVIEEYLQEHLDSLPLSLQPLSGEQQQEYLVKYLTDQGAQWDVSCVWKNLFSLRQHFCGVPLQARMLADYILTQKNSSTTVTQVNLGQLYNNFFVMKHNVYYYEKMKNDPSSQLNEEKKEDDFDNFMETHTKFALQVILDNDQRTCLGVQDCTSNKYHESSILRIQRLGIIESVSDDNIKFVHISFAEFLVARWFKEQIIEKEKESYIYYKYLLEWKLFQVKLFIDHILSEESELLRAILDNRKDDVAEILKNQEVVKKVHSDTILGVNLVAFYEQDRVEDCVKYFTEPQHDDLMGWLPVHLADQGRSWKALTSLLKYDVGEPTLRNLCEVVRDELVVQTIIIAAKTNNSNTVRLFEDFCYKLETFGRDEALHLSVAVGDVDHLKTLMIQFDNKCNINKTNRLGYTLLYGAAMCGGVDIVSYLVKQGADVGAHIDGRTALYIAAEEGHRDIVEYLYEQGADIHARENHNRRTPLYVGAQKGHKDIVEYVIEKGADINTYHGYDWTALHVAAYSGHKDIVEYLVEKGADIHIRNVIGLNALFIAAEMGHKDIVEYLFDKGADIQARDNHSRTAVYIAVQAGHKDIAEYLLQKGADIHICNNHGSNAMYVAALRGHKHVVEYLLEKGADIHVVDKYGRTALYVAALRGHIDIVRSLLEKGADIDIVDKYGTTALYMAAERGHKHVVEYLLGKGADVHTADKLGRTALYVADLCGERMVI